MPQGEGQLVGDRIAGLVAPVEDDPILFGSLASLDVAARHRAERPHRRGKAKAVHERRPADKPCSLGNGGSWKVSGASGARAVGRNSFIAVEIGLNPSGQVEKCHARESVE